MNQHRRYRNPPVEEALCEFRFKPGPDWNLTIPGKLQSEIGDDYAGKPRQQMVVDVGLEAQRGRPSKLQYGEGLGKVQLVTPDEKRIVGIGPDVLSIHILRPYQTSPRPKESGWNEFRPRIEKALGAYWKVAQPEGVIRIGIRYINKIVIPQKTLRIGDYLKCALPEVSGLPDDLKNFISRVEYAYEDGVRLVLSHGSIDAPADHRGFLLDLDMIWESSEPILSDVALAKVDNLRTREREAFETIITDKVREVFDAG